MVGQKIAPSIEGKQSRLLANSLPSDLINAIVRGLQGGLEAVTKAILSLLEKQPNIYLKSRETFNLIQSSSDDILNLSLFDGDKSKSLTLTVCNLNSFEFHIAFECSATACDAYGEPHGNCQRFQPSLPLTTEAYSDSSSFWISYPHEYWLRS
ncbi:hypothetical protein O181_057587 [Austropuccinia psidii MF-1]|uniref:Uncharacterized protein n=1 Tax=Austropuccinia psidii MF-1 TaxID=1389203 RepID=A0A9Q3HVL0_9BASI|nr:hypothetical protein [Austropuccinia psidii MF-1]